MGNEPWSHTTPYACFSYLGDISEREDCSPIYLPVCFFFLFYTRARRTRFATSSPQLTCDAREREEARMVESSKCIHGGSLVPLGRPTYLPRKLFTVTHSHRFLRFFLLLLLALLLPSSSTTYFLTGTVVCPLSRVLGQWNLPWKWTHHSSLLQAISPSRFPSRRRTYVTAIFPAFCVFPFTTVLPLGKQRCNS